MRLFDIEYAFNHFKSDNCDCVLVNARELKVLITGKKGAPDQNNIRIIIVTL